MSGARNRLQLAIEVFMAYSIHIARVNELGESFDENDNRINPISLAEWEHVVAATSGVRLTSADLVTTNPRTGEVIRIPGRPGDAGVYSVDNSAWIRVYSWFDGAISFRPSVGFEEVNDPLRNITRMLASSLQARIIGDEGEFYE